MVMTAYVNIYQRKREERLPGHDSLHVLICGAAAVHVECFANQLPTAHRTP